jgi:hypothetical protein
MNRGAHFAKQMGTSGLGIETRRRFPIEPTDIVLLRREQQRFREWLIPGPQQLAGKPGMRELADGEGAGGLFAKQHPGISTPLRKTLSRARIGCPASPGAFI